VHGRRPATHSASAAVSGRTETGAIASRAERRHTWLPYVAVQDGPPISEHLLAGIAPDAAAATAAGRFG